MQLKRLPDQWHDSRQGVAFPVMSWNVQWPPDYRPDNYEHARSFIEACLGRSSSSRDATFLSEFAAFLSVYLQRAGHLFLDDWIVVPEDSCADDRISYSFLDEHFASVCGDISHDIVSALMSSEHSSSDLFCLEANTALADAQRRIAGNAPGKSALRVILEARRRGIPVSRLSRHIPAYRFGYGHRQKRLWRGFTSHTSHLGTVLSTRKQLTSELLSAHGLPVPGHHVVQDADSALKAAHLIGYPVVVKPASTDFGTAVLTGIMTDAALVSAFEAARSHGNVLVEQQIAGATYRLVVIDGQCVDVVRLDPPHITGNGVDDVATLIDRMAEAREADPFYQGWKPATLDDPVVHETLEGQGVSPEDVLARDRTVLLRTNSNTSTGGFYSYVTSGTHPDNLKLAERAASAIGLDYAGIDFITPDIFQSWRSVGGGICEVNATPGMGVTGREVHLLNYFFRGQDDGRIPVICVVGEEAEARPVLDAVAEFASVRGATLGSVTGKEAFLGHSPISAGQQTPRELTRLVLFDQETEIALIQVTAEELLNEGLEALYCNMAVFCAGNATVTRVLESRLSVVRKAEQILIRPSPAEVTAGLGAMKWHRR